MSVSRKALIDEAKKFIESRRYELYGNDGQDLAVHEQRDLFEITEKLVSTLSESEGEAEQLRVALKLVKSEVAVYATASVYEKVCYIVNSALEGSTSETAVHSTGIVRRIDDLGRVVIPKEVRRGLGVSEGDPLEIFKHPNGGILIKKYDPDDDLGIKDGREETDGS